MQILIFMIKNMVNHFLFILISSIEAFSCLILKLIFELKSYTIFKFKSVSSA